MSLGFLPVHFTPPPPKQQCNKVIYLKLPLPALPIFLSFHPPQNILARMEQVAGISKTNLTNICRRWPHLNTSYMTKVSVRIGSLNRSAQCESNEAKCFQI